MKNNFQQCFVEVLKHEGGYVNHPNDPGGITNLGVTKKVWDEWTGKDNSANDMKALTPEMVKPLYMSRYWDACKCDDLPAGIDYCVLTPLLILDAFGLLNSCSPWLELYLMGLLALLLSLLLMDAAQI